MLGEVLQYASRDRARESFPHRQAVAVERSSATRAKHHVRHATKILAFIHPAVDVCLWMISSLLVVVCLGARSYFDSPGVLHTKLPEALWFRYSGRKLCPTTNRTPKLHPFARKRLNYKSYMECKWQFVQSTTSRLNSPQRIAVHISCVGKASSYHLLQNVSFMPNILFSDYISFAAICILTCSAITPHESMDTAPTSLQ